jgi:hypothetical protein
MVRVRVAMHFQAKLLNKQAKLLNKLPPSIINLHTCPFTLHRD